MTEQIPAILDADLHCPEQPAEGVLQVMHVKMLQADVTALQPRTWSDEDCRPHFRDNGVPLPAQVADLSISAAGILGKQRHVGELCRQSLQPPCLLLPAEWAGFVRIGFGKSSIFGSAQNHVSPCSWTCIPR